MEEKRAVVLLSGGMDSTFTACFAQQEGHKLYGLTFDYGQMHSKELDQAIRLANALGFEDHRVVRLDFTQFTKSALLGDGDIPESAEGIPSTWVPQRNAIFLAIAFSYAEVVQAQSIWIGVSQMDYSGYPDCREVFIKALGEGLNQASKEYVEEGISKVIKAPLLFLNKTDEVLRGTKMGVPWSLTWTCYRGEEKACGRCPSCKLRLEAFEKAGIKDPIEYEEV